MRPERWRRAMLWGTVAVALLATSTVRPLRVFADPARVKPLDASEFEVLALQVALDRNGYSPGEIDARPGENTDKALLAFQSANELGSSAILDDATRDALRDALRSPLSSYTIQDEDLRQEFARIPADMMAQAKLPALSYESARELIAERFHSSPALLDRLNPGIEFEAGRELRVPNVDPFVIPESKGRRPKTSAPADEGMTVVVSAAGRFLTVKDAAGTVVMYAPVTIGGERDPLPTGQFTVAGVYFNPIFNYNPDLFWDADPSHAKARIAPGPNNPVGVVWVDLNREHMGMHGTPRPSTIGKTDSHGCIRLTNWDAVRLAGLVREGTPVLLQ